MQIQPISVPVQLVTTLPMAWRHHCGHLNDSPWPTGDREGCDGCRCEIRLTEVTARYLLVELTNTERES